MQAHVAVLTTLKEELIPGLRQVLQDAGHRVSEYSSADALRKSLRTDGIDIVVLATDDLPKHVQALIRHVHDSLVPLLVVAPTQDEGFVIRVLRMGADGCLCSPFGESEFLARVEAHLRRHWEWGPSAGKGEDDLQVDTLTGSVIVQGREVRLTPTEFRLLSKLAENSGEVVTSEELCDYVWGLDSDMRPSSVRLYVSHLRRKLEPDPRRPRFIRTKWGVGYYLQRGDSES